MAVEASFKIQDKGNKQFIVSIAGGLYTANSAAFVAGLNNDLDRLRFKSVTLDIAELTGIDDFGVAVLAGIKKKVNSKRGTFRFSNIQPAVHETLQVHNFDKLTAPPAALRSSPGIFTSLGSVSIDFATKTAFSLDFLGETMFAFWRFLRKPGILRFGDTIINMRKVGVDALPIVALISFLLGLIMAFMSSVQLKQFGANIYVASLVSLSMTRELGPIMTAIIVAGRSSSAFAAEIGSMKISEEIDALFTMGINPHQYLVLPRVIATFLMVPLLTLFSDVFAIAGGLVVGTSMLGLTVDGYMTQTFKTLSLFDVFWGLCKGGIFALFLSWIGCLRGFQVKEGADDVGRATTSAVVTSIFLIILLDSIMVVILRYYQ
jgi:phospholipid/cholesterol/gamma-HCH transport system permease protein